ncbi:Histidine kinase-, DNA gyrase B-, and HSP90-like ATPase [Pseudomonas sp. NFPP07]|uniref:HD domain-containing protein n=1 Tax=Pseudomonas sp. NFPP07 TaxID=1566213 RepID=UPI0008E5B7EE|nr:ATP-binding protein [Pseudomonas sp. NFPP07]SFQ80141.1 Histidine kinase-, DNA gyrase B-, and HSP90-like ATPase [Pseudomonas sp. NFPP07]
MSEMPLGYALYNRTLNSNSTEYKVERDKLRGSFLAARNNVKHLIASIHTQLHGLTVHDISHVDSLWRLADEILGTNYPLNEAEAYVLGGAFLLHDSAHTKEAFAGGIEEIKKTIEWKDLIGQNFDQNDPTPNSPEEKQALFFTLRHLHADQAKILPKLRWNIPGCDDQMYIIEDFELREYYGDLIGELAASHHWSTSEVLQTFEKRVLSPPSCLENTNWDVDALKIAFILRTADAAHLDAKRAPWFLFALQQPEGVSQEHWRFQAKMGVPRLTNSNELKFTAGSSFSASEKRAWWLAYDTINMVDKELRHAHSILGEFGRTQFAAERVTGAGSVELFSKHVRAIGWEPIDTSPKISNIPFVIANLGGAALYGEHPYVAIRELIQNSADSIRALRNLGYIDENEGKITVTLSFEEDIPHITIKDNGLGMSKFVLTNVLTDFGTSLWRSAHLRSELPGLASTQFKSVGKFGIGFFSVFMLGENISIITRRFEPKAGEESQWKMQFEHGLPDRPTVSQPSIKERLRTQGTEIKIALKNGVLKSLLNNPKTEDSMDYLNHETKLTETKKSNLKLERLVKTIFPMADIDIYCQYNDETPYKIITANDWKKCSDKEIHQRTSCDSSSLTTLTDKEGNIIGKLAIGTRYISVRPASITFQGLWCGELSGVTGFIATTSNNREASRHDGVITSDISIWKKWASDVLATEKDLSFNKLLALHPLVPNLDLPVWTQGGKLFSTDQLKRYLSTIDKILIHYGELKHESHDEMSSDSFESGLSLKPELICIPHFSPSRYAKPPKRHVRYWINSSNQTFPWNIGATPIDYSETLISLLDDVWGNYTEIDDEEYVIGSVDHTELIRNITIYSRS